MFGTDRIIECFSLNIRKSPENNNSANLQGIISYQYELDFQVHIQPDSFVISIDLDHNRFDELRSHITQNEINKFSIHLSTVDGFYSEWSPSVRTNNIKILAQQEVEIDEEIKFSPPRLGSDFEFSLYFDTNIETKNKLEHGTTENLKKQDEENNKYKEIFLEKISYQNQFVHVILAQTKKQYTATILIAWALWLLVVLTIIGRFIK